MIRLTFALAVLPAPAPAEAFLEHHMAKLEAAPAAGETPSCAACNLSYANLSGLDLGGADLRGAFPCGALLQVTVLRGANLERADLTRTDPVDAKRRRTVMPGGSRDDRHC